MTTNATSPFKRVLPGDFSNYKETSPLIPVGSTLSVLGALITIARDRFVGSTDDSIPWVWVPKAGSSIPVEDPMKSSITIEPAYKDDTPLNDKKAGIFVGRSVVNNERLMLNDNVGEHRQTGAIMRYNWVSCAFSFSCRSYRRGVAETLANILFEWLMYNADNYRKCFQFHTFGPFSMGPEVPMQKSSDLFECVIECRISWEHRWSTVPLSPKLRGVIMSIYSAADGDTSDAISLDDDLLVQIATNVSDD